MHYVQGKAVDDFTEIPRDRLEKTFLVNIVGMISLAQKALPHMKPGSAIINVRWNFNMLPYGISCLHASACGCPYSEARKLCGCTTLPRVQSLCNALHQRIWIKELALISHSLVHTHIANRMLCSAADFANVEECRLHP